MLNDTVRMGRVSGSSMLASARRSAAPPPPPPPGLDPPVKKISSGPSRRAPGRRFHDAVVENVGAAPVADAVAWPGRTARRHCCEAAAELDHQVDASRWVVDVVMLAAVGNRIRP